MCREEVSRISQTTVYISAYIYIPCCRIFTNRIVVCSCVDLYLYSDLFQSALCSLCQQRQFLTAWIGKPPDGQLLSVFFTDSITIAVGPSGFFQNRFRCFRIISLRIQCGASERYCIREGTRCHISISIQKHLDKGFLINTHGNGFTDCVICHNRRCIIHLYVKGTAGLHTGKLELVIFKNRIACICHTICRIDLAGLQCQCQSISI